MIVKFIKPSYIFRMFI